MKTIITTFPFYADFSNLNVVYKNDTKKHTQEEIKNILFKYNPECIIAGTEKYGEEELDLCPNLKVISRVGVGTSSIDNKACKKRGIKILNTPSAPSSSVAEFTVSLILCMIKKLYKQDVYNWEKHLCKDLTELSIGIVGYGRIGRLVKSKIQSFNPKNVIIHDPFYENNYLELETVFKKSDIITFHIPEIQDKITHKDFKKMKKNVVLINTSRGSIFNEEDLFKFLQETPLASAALDVFEEEPTTNKKLLQLPNIFATPHVASFSEESRKKMEKESIENIISYVRGSRK